MSMRRGILTNLFVMMLCLKSYDLQDAGVGDVRNNVGHSLPHTQQGTTQHVVLSQPHALQTLLAFFCSLTFPIPTSTRRK